MMALLQPFTRAEYTFKILIKYARIVGTLMFISIGLALYSLRRIRIIRAIGNLKNEDSLRIVYKRVFDF